jgi:hypothetical protein
MSWRFAGISLILAIPTIAAIIPGRLRTQEPIPPEWLQEPPATDPESRLAMGTKLPLACADISSLELLKGVSDKLATELINSRSSILEKARTSSPFEALQLAHGIGSRTSLSLLRYLEVGEKCKGSDPYEPWPPE